MVYGLHYSGCQNSFLDWLWRSDVFSIWLINFTIAVPTREVPCSSKDLMHGIIVFCLISLIRVFQRMFVAVMGHFLCRIYDNASCLLPRVWGLNVIFCHVLRCWSVAVQSAVCYLCLLSCLAFEQAARMRSTTRIQHVKELYDGETLIRTAKDIFRRCRRDAPPMFHGWCSLG